MADVATSDRVHDCGLLARGRKLFYKTLEGKKTLTVFS
jgi:hypothetical protein